MPAAITMTNIATEARRRVAAACGMRANMAA
jgi:hypothetical protein